MSAAPITSPLDSAATVAIAVVGPTAVGKSALALALAERLGGEILSADSMQVYRGLDIGTAKPSAEELARVRHHLIDVAELTETFDAARFVALASAAEDDIRARGRKPIFCGGTGLYLKALWEGLGESPPADPAIRVLLEAMPAEEQLRELEQTDPATFAAIDRRNGRRVIRALEVIRLTGRPFSEQRARWGAAASPPRSAPILLGLRRHPEDLRRRIDARVDAMFAAGLVEETRALLPRLEQNRTALQAIGYRQVVEHLRGERGLAETIALVKQKTRQFAKRQGTWFRNQLPVRWIDAAPEDDVGALLERIPTQTTGPGTPI